MISIEDSWSLAMHTLHQDIVCTDNGGCSLKVVDLEILESFDLMFRIGFSKVHAHVLNLVPNHFVIQVHRLQ
jgi:hypothetical protein